MPGMRPLDLPATGLAAGMDHRIDRFAPLRRNMAGILFEDEYASHRRIIERGIQTQMVRMGAIRLGPDDR